jgi:hypothetical protein
MSVASNSPKGAAAAATAAAAAAAAAGAAPSAGIGAGPGPSAGAGGAEAPPLLAQFSFDRYHGSNQQQPQQPQQYADSVLPVSAAAIASAAKRSPATVLYGDDGDDDENAPGPAGAPKNSSQPFPAPVHTALAQGVPAQVHALQPLYVPHVQAPAQQPHALITSPAQRPPAHKSIAATPPQSQPQLQLHLVGAGARTGGIGGATSTPPSVVRLPVSARAGTPPAFPRDPIPTGALAEQPPRQQQLRQQQLQQQPGGPYADINGLSYAYGVGLADFEQQQVLPQSPAGTRQNAWGGY